MGDRPEFTNQEKQTLERMKEVCAKHGEISNRTLTDCALSKGKKLSNDKSGDESGKLKIAVIQKI